MRRKVYVESGVNPGWQERVPLGLHEVSIPQDESWASARITSTYNSITDAFERAADELQVPWIRQGNRIIIGEDWPSEEFTEEEARKLVSGVFSEPHSIMFNISKVNKVSVASDMTTYKVTQSYSGSNLLYKVGYEQGWDVRYLAHNMVEVSL